MLIPPWKCRHNFISKRWYVSEASSPWREKKRVSLKCWWLSEDERRNIFRNTGTFLRYHLPEDGGSEFLWKVEASLNMEEEICPEMLVPFYRIIIALKTKTAGTSKDRFFHIKRYCATTQQTAILIFPHVAHWLTLKLTSNCRGIHQLVTRTIHQSYTAPVNCFTPVCHQQCVVESVRKLACGGVVPAWNPPLPDSNGPMEAVTPPAPQKNTPHM